MNLHRIPLLGVAVCLATPPVQALDVLFVGNSFTFGNSTYNASAITDANGTGHGGLPAAFKKLATEGGHANVNVTIEAVNGQTLTWHHANKAAIIGRAWDYVVLQDHSQRPLTTFVNGNVAAFRTAVQNLNTLLKTHNPAVRVLLYETWARPDMVPAYYTALSVMQGELRAAYSAAATDFALHGWVPVGDGYMEALDTGLAYNPTQGAQAGKFNLFVGDNYHPSGHGCYLGACLFYAKILGGDPRLLPTGAGSAAAALGVSAADAANLQQLAYSLVPLPATATAILVQPKPAAAFPGGKASFAVTAGGTGLGYQWRRDGVELPGKTTATLQLTNTQPADAGLYDVVVSGALGTMVSESVSLTVTSRQSTSVWLIDLGAAVGGGPTASPDASGLFWNQMTSAVAGATLAPVVTSTGSAHATGSVSVVTAFSGFNQGGTNASGPYPATAQRDSFYVTGTGTSGAARKGEILFSGLAAGGAYSLRLFGSRAATGARVTRFSTAGAAPVYLDAVNNSANTVELGPVSPQPNGTLLLTVEPYDAAGTLMEYGYLGVIEVREATPAPSAYETWTSVRGLADTEAAHDADPDGDGRANLLEFALGTEPALADGSTAATVALVGQAAGGGGYLELVVNKPAAAAGQVSYAAEVSSDLAAWTGDVTVLADSATIFRARDNVALSGVSRRFIRLVVTGAP